jgi:hypothetical protein
MMTGKVFFVKYNRATAAQADPRPRRDEWLNHTITFDRAVAEFSKQQLTSAGIEALIEERETKPNHYTMGYMWRRQNPFVGEPYIVGEPKP